MACSAGWRQGPFWVMGAAAVASGALCVLLPETLGAPQPDTLADVERNARRPQAALRYQVRMCRQAAQIGCFVYLGACVYMYVQE